MQRLEKKLRRYWALSDLGLTVRSLTLRVFITNKKKFCNGGFSVSLLV
jgi:hypothetical protein